MIIDTHTHIYLNKNQSIDEIISKLGESNISKIISIGIDLESSITSIQLARQYPWIVYASVGIHPCDVGKYKNSYKETMNQLEHLVLENLPYVKAIGECGFDYHRIDKENFSEEQKLQKQFFEWQLALAKKFLLPVVIHTREAKDDTLASIKNIWVKKFILHCFSEDLDFAYKSLYYSDECYISFSGIVTYKSAKSVQNVAANIPTDKILIETDCPFLAPQAVRGTENIPNNATYNLQHVFDLRKENGKKENFEEFKQQVYQNSLKVFQLP